MSARDGRGRCGCTGPHPRRRIVLTGGPGAGKTAVLELLRRSLCDHVVMLPEAAGLLFTGGFPRQREPDARRAAQRAIFHVQRELEAMAETRDAAAIICDRGVVDGVAYWPGGDPRAADFWTQVGMTRAEALARYDVVLHLRVPDGPNGYGHQNPLRTETAEEARAIDERILAAWSGHPRRFVLYAESDFMAKARRAHEILVSELPECCRGVPVVELEVPARAVHASSGAATSGVT